MNLLPKHSGWFSSLVLLAACTFQSVSPLSELPLEPEASSWEQLGNLMSQGVTPAIAFDENGKPFAAHSSSGRISVSACTYCHSN